MAKNCVKGVPCGASCCAKRDGSGGSGKKASKPKMADKSLGLTKDNYTTTVKTPNTEDVNKKWKGRTPADKGKKSPAAKTKLKAGHVVDSLGKPSFSQMKTKASKAQAEKKLSSIANSQKLDKTVRKPKTPIVPGVKNKTKTSKKATPQNTPVKSVEFKTPKPPKAKPPAKSTDTLAPFSSIGKKRPTPKSRIRRGVTF